MAKIKPHEVRRRLLEALRHIESLSANERAALREWHNGSSPESAHPEALAVVGVAWVDGRYKEVPAKPDHPTVARG